MIQLREYQREAMHKIRHKISLGCRRVMLCLPTGSGKTYTAGAIIAGALSKGRRCLFVAHRLELIDQSVAAFTNLGIGPIGVIRAGDIRRNPDARVHVASIQTLARRKQADYDLVIIDEAHRACASTYTKHLFERHERAVIIGLSATPCRTDGKPLGERFDDLVVGALYSGLIESGAIVAPHVYSTPMAADMSRVRTTAGDFNQQDLEEAVNKGALVGNILAEWQKHPRQRTVVFAVSVAHSQNIVTIFREAGVRAEHLDGTTPETERRAILARLASGETDVVSNVGVLCEGWDLPSCKTLIVARPTKSLSLYMQMAGRILRPWQGVTPVILDHGGNVDRHGFPHEDREWSLEGKVKRDQQAPEAKVCKQCFAYVARCARVCPYCGFSFAEDTTVPERKEQEAIPVDLELRKLGDDSDRLRYFRDLCVKCRDRGWQPMAAWHRFKERFGEYPPSEWVEAMKRSYRADKLWKTTVAERRKRVSEEAENAA